MSSDEQDPLQSLFAEILEAENRGESVNRDALIDEHPDVRPKPGFPGNLRWGSIFNGAFFIDPQEELVGIAIGRLFPTELEWRQKFTQLVYAAIDD